MPSLSNYSRGWQQFLHSFTSSRVTCPSLRIMPQRKSTTCVNYRVRLQSAVELRLNSLRSHDTALRSAWQLSSMASRAPDYSGEGWMLARVHALWPPHCRINAEMVQVAEGTRSSVAAEQSDMSAPCAARQYEQCAPGPGIRTTAAATDGLAPACCARARVTRTVH